MFFSSLLHFARFIYSHYRLFILRMRFKDVKIYGPTNISFDDIDAIIIGSDVSIGPFSEVVVMHTSALSSVHGRLNIGNRVIIGKGANIRAAGGEINIGDGALLAQNVSLIAANHSLNTTLLYRDAPWDIVRVGVTIRKNVWIGAGVIVLPGVVVGENSVIAAGSVVTKNIPDNQIWAGIPARCIKVLGQNENCSL